MIEFLEDTHTYLKDGVILPSVSEILHFIFPNKYKGISELVLKRKADYGTKIHEAIELYEKGLGIPELTYIQEASFKQYQKLEDKHDIEVLSQEQIVSYEDKYCGRYDMIAWVKREYSLVDIKTTAELDIEYLSWQLSYYELASGRCFDKLYVIWLPKKELGQLVEIPRKTETELLNKLEEFLKEKEKENE